MRMLVNYGAVRVSKNRIRVGVSLISQITGIIMLSVVAFLIIFIIAVGGGPYLFSRSSAQLWILGALIIYLGLRFVGAWSDTQIIDGAAQEVRVNKHWLFVPYSRKTFPFRSIRSVTWQEIINRKVGASQLDTRTTQVMFYLKDKGWLTVASISWPDPDKTLKSAETLARVIADMVGCPIDSPAESKVVLG